MEMKHNMKRIWCNNGTEEKLIRNKDYLPTGFVLGRLQRKETKLDKLSAKYPYEFVYDLYIIQNESFIEIVKKLGITEKDFRRLLTRYKIKKSRNLSQKNNTYIRPHELSVALGKKSSETQKKMWQNKTPQQKTEWSRKQSEAHSTESFKSTISNANKLYYQRAMTECPDVLEERNNRRRESCKDIWTAERLQKRAETAKQNRVLQKSKLCRTISEQKLYDCLLQEFEDLQYDVRVDDRYPFFCDFYIPSLDLFIELQAHQSHGKLPINYLNENQFPDDRYRDVFARRDVEKYETALKNNINLIRVYPRASLSKNIEINPKQFSEIVEKCFRSQR